MKEVVASRQTIRQPVSEVVIKRIVQLINREYNTFSYCSITVSLAPWQISGPLIMSLIQRGLSLLCLSLWSPLSQGQFSLSKCTIINCSPLIGIVTYPYDNSDTASLLNTTDAADE